MNAPNEPSSSPSDLELARLASTRALGKQQPIGDVFDVGYTRLPTRTKVSAAAYAPPSPTTTQAQAADAPLPTPPPLDSAWDVILGWCVQAAGATGAYLMSAEGLTIAQVGAEEGVADSGGARLVIAHEHGRRVFSHDDSFDDGVDGTLHFEKDGVWVTGMRIPTPNVGCLTLGMISTAPPSSRVQENIRAVLGEQLDAQRERS